MEKNTVKWVRTLGLAGVSFFLIYAAKEETYQPPLELKVPARISGETQYLRIPVVALIYTHVTRWPVELIRKPTDPPTVKTVRKKVPPPPQVPDSEVERIMEELRLGQLFYWTNSSMKCFVDVFPIVVKDALEPKDIYDTSEYRFPLAEDVKKRLAEYGFEPLGSNPVTPDTKRAAGLLHLVIEQVWNEKEKKWVYSGRGGGFTVGPDIYGVGVSWWQVTPADAGPNNQWLMVHEFHHDLDAMFAFSGQEDYWFNHPSPTENNVARLGEHYDDNAYILRRWLPLEKWFTNHYGEVKSFIDRDEDGVPDDDPTLPVDEKRFGSSPDSKDTDRDGLTDLEEVMAWNGINRGLGDVFMSEHFYPDPKNPDSDSDGILDGDDPYPLYPIHPFIPMKSPEIDGKLEDDEWSKFAEFKDERIQGILYVQWKELDALYFALELPGPAGIKIQIDALNDGWFIGRDNYRIVVNKEGKVTETTIIDSSSPGKWPHDDKTFVKPEDVRVVHSREGEKNIYEIAIPRNWYTGLSLEPCQILGLNIGLKPDDGNPFYVMLFEPHTLVQLRLVKPTESCKV